MTIFLPWPPRILSPNARVHWAKKSKITKTYRLECFVITRQSGAIVSWDGDIHLFVTFYPPDRRRRDDDNIISSFKAGRDGIADALNVNDNRFVIHPYLSDKVRSGGIVEVRIARV
jgi:crossover junction endodeoxyribonuclease RusA